MIYYNIWGEVLPVPHETDEVKTMTNCIDITTTEALQASLPEGEAEALPSFMERTRWYMRKDGMTIEEAVERVELDSQRAWEAYQNDAQLRAEINGRVYRAVVAEEVSHV